MVKGLKDINAMASILVKNYQTHWKKSNCGQHLMKNYVKMNLCGQEEAF
jgi:hypothetical protein